mgnify:CR=1 FL=1
MPRHASRSIAGRPAERAERAAVPPVFGVDQHGGAGLGEFADLAHEFPVSPLCGRARARHFDGDQQFPFGEIRGVGAGNKPVQWNAPLAVRTCDNRGRAQAGHHDDPVRRRVRMGEAAAHRAAVAHGAVGDVARCGLHPATRGIGHLAVLDLGMGGGRAETDMIGAFGDRPQFRHGCDIDQPGGPGKPQVHHWPERLVAGHRLVAGFGEKRLRQGICAREVECSCFHDVCPPVPAFASASRMRSGVSGMSDTSAPSGLSASFTALAMAAGGPIAPLSPMPFWP